MTVKNQKALQNMAMTISMSSRQEEKLLSLIYHYFNARGLQWPTMEEALYWAHTESGEVFEQLLARKKGWVRNNPEKHRNGSQDAILEEISDQVFMLLVAGMVTGQDILSTIQAKMKRKLEEHEKETGRTD